MSAILRLPLARALAVSLGSIREIRAAKAEADAVAVPWVEFTRTLRSWPASAGVVYGSDYCFTPPVGVGLHLGALDAFGVKRGTDWRAVLAANGDLLLGSPPPIGPPAPEPRRAAIVRRIFTKVATKALIP